MTGKVKTEPKHIEQNRTLIVHPPLERHVLTPSKVQLWREGWGSGGGCGRGEGQKWSGACKTVHGRVEGGRSQGGARSRSSHAETQATASTIVQGKVAGWRSHGGGLGGGTNDAVMETQTEPG